LVGGMDGDCDAARCLADVLAGVSERSFVGLDSTLDSYRSLSWRPALFERDLLAQWRTQGARTIRQQARAMIADLIGRHEYELDRETQAGLDGILARARAALS
jgi:trimethylamine:corrinoid methyltransferase-like protein